ncbi:unnamed protein product, partial [marine sediment metagenome]
MKKQILSQKEIDYISRLPKNLKSNEKNLLNEYLQKKYKKYYKIIYLLYNKALTNQEKKSLRKLKIKLEELIEIWNKYISKQEKKEVIDFRKKALENIKVDYCLTKGIYIGEDIVPKIISKFLTKAIVIINKTSFNYFNNIFPSLNFKKVPHIFIASHLDAKILEKIINYAKKNKIETVIGIGGGRVIDYLKFISFKSNKPAIAIPTSLATHVYASPKIHAGGAIAQLGFKKTINGEPPQIAI